MGSSRFRDWTQVSCVGRWILFHLATKEALFIYSSIHLWLPPIACGILVSWTSIKPVPPLVEAHRFLSTVPLRMSKQHRVLITGLPVFSHCVWLVAIPWTAARQAPLSSTVPWSLLKLMSIELVMPSNHLILCHPFSSCPQSFLASGSFPVSWLFASGGQSIGTLASIREVIVHTMILVFLILSFKPAFSLSSFTPIKRLFSSSSLSASRVVSSAYLGFLIFLPDSLIPAYNSSSLAFHMEYSA